MPSTQRFRFFSQWITRDNVVPVCSQGLSFLGEAGLDIISVDLDGNDLYIVQALLEAGIQPRLFIVEYNAKFPPPIKFSITYDERHRWNGDDYFGASLSSFDDLFRRFDYRLVCCNAQTGVNAFFIQNRYAHLFSDVPIELDALFVPPRYHRHRAYGHRTSPRVAELILRGQ